MNRRHTPFIFALLFLTSLSTFTASAQEAITMGYFSRVGIQPGIQAGLLFDLGSINDSGTRARSVFLSPQAAVFTRPGINTNYLLRVESGISQKSRSERSFSALSVSAGYLFKTEVESVSVSLGSGEITDKARTNTHHFVPALHSTYGRYFSEKWSWFTKIGLGYRFEKEDLGTTTLFFEAGVHLSLKNIAKS